MTNVKYFESGLLKILIIGKPGAELQIVIRVHSENTITASGMMNHGKSKKTHIVAVKYVPIIDIKGENNGSEAILLKKSTNAISRVVIGSVISNSAEAN